ncbi:hypothetical protein CLU79DRAFT_773567 [Phycomyces nitens]|nr:hypothetical protein CLU79DRAFT_773567 [Phycomyces nitens]
MHGLACCIPQESVSSTEKLEEKEHLLQIHFSFEGGIRQVCDAWQSYHDKRAKDHQAFGQFLQTQWLPSLAAIKRELKWMLRAVRSDDRLTLSTLGRLKEETEKRLERLDRQLTFFNQHPDHGYSRQDPWLMNAAVVEQIIKLHRQENKFHETVLRLQQETLISEEQLIEEFRSLCQQLYAMQEKSELGIDRGFQSVMDTFERVKMDGDWLDFAERAKDNLVSENAAFRRPDERLEYPNHSHPLLQPIFAARMERKSSVLHHWHEHIYVLTPAGFLHEYKSTKSYPEHPSTSIFVPHYNVSTISTHLLHHNLVFQLQPQSNGGASRRLFYPAPSSMNSLPREWGSASSSSPRSMLRPSSAKTITFRAKSAKDMQAWLEQLTATSHRFRPSVSYTAPPDLEPTRSLELMNPVPATSLTNHEDLVGSEIGETDEKTKVIVVEDKIQEAFPWAGPIEPEVEKTEEGETAPVKPTDVLPMTVLLCGVEQQDQAKHDTIGSAVDNAASATFENTTVLEIAVQEPEWTMKSMITGVVLPD